MSGKKSPPALYELYHKGKKSRGGLFGRRKKLNIDNVYDIPSVAAPVSNPSGSFKPVSGNDIPVSPPVEEEYSDSSVGFEVEYGRITMVLPVWLFVMVVLAILTSLLAAYKLGATSEIAVSGEEGSVGETVLVEEDARLNADPAAEMVAALNSEPVTGLVNNYEALENNNAEGTESAAPVIQRPARCLIVFGDTNLEGLESVRDFFASKGLPLEIVKRSGSRGYTLVTRDGFVSTRETEYSSLKAKILSIGKSYIVNRESGWPRISERTFDTAYPIDTSKLTYE